MADEETQTQEGPAQTQQNEQPEEDQTDSQEQPAEEGGTPLFSPEGFMMMSIAGTIDAIGIILLFFGLDDFGITDFVAYSTIGPWMIMRGSGFKKPTAGGEEAMQKAAKIAKRLKWIKPLAFIGELVPYFGALPLWSVTVHTELKS